MSEVLAPTSPHGSGEKPSRVCLWSLGYRDNSTMFLACYYRCRWQASCKCLCWKVESQRVATCRTCGAKLKRCGISLNSSGIDRPLQVIFYMNFSYLRMASGKKGAYSGEEDKTKKCVQLQDERTPVVRDRAGTSKQRDANVHT